MAKGQVVVVVSADSGDFEQKIKRANEAFDQFDKKGKSVNDRLVDTGKKMTLFATAPIVAGLGLATNAASNLEQSMGAVDSIFGQSRGTIDAWAATAAESAGLSRREVNEMAAVLGASLQGLGFNVADSAEKVVELQKRGADMAATFGGSTKDALDAVAAALRGERDPIEKYGVSIKQVDVNARVMALGLDTSTASAKKKSEAIATLDLLMSQTAKTEGQFARESDSAAGAQQRASAAIENSAAKLGQNLLPLAADATDVVADLAGRFGDLPPAVQKGVLALGGLVAATGPILSVAGNVGKLADKIKAVDLSAVAAKAPLLGLAGGVLALAIAIDAANASLHDKLNRSIDELAQKSDKELVEAFEKGGRSLQDFEIIADRNVGVAIRLRDALREQGQSTEQLDAVIDEHVEAQRNVETATKAATDAVSGQADAAGADAAAQEELAQELEGVKKVLDGLVPAVVDEESALEDVADAAKDAGDAHATAVKDVESAEKAVKSATDRVEDLTKALEDAKKALEDALKPASEDDLEGAALGVERALVRQGDAMRDVTEATAELDRLRRRSGTAEEIERAERDVTDARFDAADAADRVREREAALKALRESGTATTVELDKATRDLREARIAEQRAIEDLAQAQKDLDRLRSPATPEQIAEAERRLEDAIRDQRDAVLDLREAQRRQQEVQAQGSEQDERVIDARGRLRETEDRLREAQGQARRANDELRSAQDRLTESAQVAEWWQAVLTNRLDLLAKKFPELRSEVDAYKRSLDLIPRNVSTSIEQNYVSRGGSSGGTIVRRAAGGPVEAGVPFIGNEGGNEMFVASMDGRVVSRNDALNALRGGGDAPVVNVYIGERQLRDIVTEVVGRDIASTPVRRRRS